MLFTSPGLRVRVAIPRAGFLLITVGGGVTCAEDEVLERAVLREMDLELERSGMVTIFCDLREMTRMAPESREAFGAWGKKNQKRINISHVLIRSKLIEMATTLIGMLAGGTLKSYSRPHVFLDAIQRAIPKLTALPELPKG